MSRGAKVQVFEKRDDWVRISIDGQPAKWLSSNSLCSGSNCYIASKPKPWRSPVHPTRRQMPKYGTSCPCSSGNLHRAMRRSVLHYFWREQALWRVIFPQ
ncbi:hypothetical protein ORL50_13300 [Pseudomonas mandelii]|nr:hypothetical protein [Pseudomonas mandelii]